MSDTTKQTQLDRIEIGVDRINGRVRSLEIWRGFITGAVAVIAFAIVLLLKGLI